MSLTDAWLVLIAGVSLLQFDLVDARFELNQKTCNIPLPGAGLDESAFMMKCFVGNECGSQIGEWTAVIGPQLDTCKAMIAIRPMRDGLTPPKGGARWKIVLQIRGSALDHVHGMKLATGDTLQATKNPIVSCTGESNKGNVKLLDHEYEIESGKSVSSSAELTICEFILKRKNSNTLVDSFKNYLFFSYKDKEQNPEKFQGHKKSKLTADLEDRARCNFPEIEKGDLTKETQFISPVSDWEQDLSCARPDETIENVKKFKLHYQPKSDKTRRADKITCDGSSYHATDHGRTTSDSIVDSSNHLRAVCIANACSLCAKPDCPSGESCPEFIGSPTDDDMKCVELKCAKDGKTWWKVDDAEAAQGTVVCAKLKEGAWEIEEGKGKEYYGWTFNGRKADKLRCAKPAGGGCPQLKVDPKSNDTLTITPMSATCDEGKMGFKEDDKNVVIQRLDCKGAVWEQTASDGGANATSPFNVDNTLRCSSDDKGAAAVTGANTNIVAIGAVAGVLALGVIVGVVVFCCCCRNKKKKGPETTKGASMTAVSSGDHVKKSESSQVKSAPPAPASIPVTMEPIKEKSKSALVAPRSDNVSEQNKEATKKEFLKFDDSNMSDIQNVSKKPDETERLDVLQQEADKLSQEQKQKAAEEKKQRELYPRLADIDDDWNDSKEEKKKEAEKKPQQPSDKTTIQSKLTSRPLHPAPHDDGQYEALGMQTVMMEKTAIADKTSVDDESGTSKKSTKTRTKMNMPVDGSRKGEESKKESKNETKSGVPPTELRTALDAKLADLLAEKTAIYNDRVEEGETQAGTRTKTTMATGKTKATTLGATQTKDGTTMGATQMTGATTTQRTRTQTRTRGDPTQMPSFEGVTARDPTANDETQMATDGVTAVGPTTNDPTQMTDGRTAREVTANDVTQGTDGRTAMELTPVDFTQGGTRTGRTAKELTAADFTQNRTLTGRTARSATRGDETQMGTEGRTAITKTRATRTQDQTTRTADQETQDPTVINDPTQLFTRTRTSRTQDGTAFDPTQDPTTFNDRTQLLTEGRTGMTKTRASRTQMTRTAGTTQDPTAFDPTQDPTAFEQTQLTGGGRTRTTRTQAATTATQADPTRFDGTQDQTTMNDQTQLITEGRTGMTKTRASRTQDATRTGATQDQTGFDPTQDPTAFEQTQLTGGGRTRTTRTQAATTATQGDPTRTGFTQDQTMVGEPTQITDGGRTGVTRTRARSTQEQTRDPTGTQEATMIDGATQMTDGRTGVTKTRATRTQDPTRTPGRTQDPTTAFDQTQVNTDGRTAVSRTKVTRTQDQTGTRTKDRTQDPTTAFDGTQVLTDGKTAVSRTKGRTTQGETTAADGTQLQTEGRTAVSRTKGRTTQDGTTAVNDGTQVPTDGKTAVSRTKGRTTQDGTTAVNDGTQVQTEGRTAVSRTKGRTTQDGTTAVNDGTQVPTDGKTAVSRTKGRTTQDGTTAVNDGTQVQTEGQTAVSKTKAGRTQEPTTAVTRGQTTRTQEPTTAPTRGQTTRTQEATGAKTRTKSQEGTRTPQDTQADGQTDAKERTGSKERTKERQSRTGAEATTQPKTQSRTGAEGTQQAPSE